MESNPTNVLNVKLVITWVVTNFYVSEILKELQAVKFTMDKTFVLSARTHTTSRRILV